MRTFTIFLFVGVMIHLGALSSAEAREISLKPATTSNLAEAGAPRLKNSVECREISDIPGTIFCIAKTKAKLTKMMGRASYFVESNFKGTIADESSPRYSRSDAANYAGHDIFGEDYDHFYKTLEIECLKNSKFCANTLEKELKTKVIDSVKARFENYVVIATWIGTSHWAQVISHEIFHARFFLNQEYRLAVEDFWMTTVEPEDRQTIHEVLSRTYDLGGANGNLLLLNEFQAYTLNKDAEFSDLGIDPAKYKNRLKQRLSVFLKD